MYQCMYVMCGRCGHIDVLPGYRVLSIFTTCVCVHTCSTCRTPGVYLWYTRTTDTADNWNMLTTDTCFQLIRSGTNTDTEKTKHNKLILINPPWHVTCNKTLTTLFTECPQVIREQHFRHLTKMHQHAPTCTMTHPRFHHGCQVSVCLLPAPRTTLKLGTFCRPNRLEKKQVNRR